MRSFYLWAMRNGAPVLFALSAILFFIGVGQALVGFRSALGGSVIAGQHVSEGLTDWLMLATGVFAALSAAVLPFIGAVATYRWDLWTRDGGHKRADEHTR